jgi:serine/threonine protein kinase
MSEPIFPTDMPAEPIAGYRLVKQLGKGGFGEVWEAIGPYGFRVALKFVSLAGPVGEQELRALEVIKNIRHAHLVAMFGAWQVAGRLVVAMELADQTLFDRLCELQRQGGEGIPGPELLGYMQEAAKGIDFLNEGQHKGEEPAPVGIQHRDIKPRNLLLIGGTVKVADFGLAQLQERSMVCPGGFTHAYAAPEFFEGRIARQSDQYCLAVTYCHLRGGRLPFNGDAAALMAGHLQKQPDLTMLPSGERPVVARALAKDPAARWPNCQEFVQALASVNSLEQLPTTPNGVTVDPTPGPRRNRRMRLAGVTALTLLVVACMTIALLQIRAYNDRTIFQNPKISQHPTEELTATRWIEPPSGQLEAWKRPTDRVPPSTPPLVDIFRAKWRTLASTHTEDGRAYPRARLAKGDPCVLADASLLAFDMQPRTGLPWVKVEEISVVVTDYQPMLSRYTTMTFDSKQRAHLYFVEIDHPSRAKTNDFVAQYYEQGQGYEKSKHIPDMFVRLENGKPEAFLVGIRAKTPGLYTLFCELSLSSRDLESKQVVGETETVFFY